MATGQMFTDLHIKRKVGKLQSYLQVCPCEYEYLRNVVEVVFLSVVALY